MRKALTDKFLETVVVKAQTEFWDQGCEGLALRVTPSGRKTWFTIYRVNGIQKRLTFGTYPMISLHDARGMARTALAQAKNGIDPRAEKAKAEQDARDRTVRALGVLFIEKHAKPKNRSWREQERHFLKYINPVLGDKLVSVVTADDVDSLISSIADSGMPNGDAKRHAWTERKKGQGSPIQARRVLATLSKFYNWPKIKRLVPTSPCRLVAKPGKETARERILKPAEIQALWTSADEIGYPFGWLVQLLILTGARRDEVGTMQWRDLDLDTGTWTIPATKSKNGKTHILPLSSTAVDILKSLPRLGEFVFTTTGDVPFAAYSKGKARLDRLSGVTDWTLHDLRRTLRSGLSKLRVPFEVAEKILNHVPKDLRKIYDQYDYADECRLALDAWASVIRTTVGGQPENIVQLRGHNAQAS